MSVATDDSSATRVASYVVSGIGFLGGGVILREGFNVRGLNTAATLWCSAAVGVLAASGHIAGVANPPDGGKYGHWINQELPVDSEQWLEGATEMAGSWWPDWLAWLRHHDETEVPARIPGEGELKPIEDAPGSYVKVQA